MPDHLEVEDKYDVSDDAAVPDLARLPGVASVAGPVDVHLVATYFDTPERVLLADGITLRRRTGGSDAGWHLKLPGDQARVEVHAPLGRAVHTVPRRLRSTIFGLVRDRPLAPVVTLRTRRTIHRLLDDGGAVLAELADDRVTSETPDGGGTAWREWEIELVAGDPNLLAEAAAVLRGAGAVSSAWPAKLVRALGRAAETGIEAQPVTPGSPSSVLIGARLAEQVDELRRRDPMVRRDVPDSVHKMRVATRRLRSALATYRPFLDARRTEPLRSELKWLGGVLGPARDAEVLRDRLLAMLDAEPAVLVRGRVRSRVRREMSSRYRSALAESVQEMQGARYLALLDRVSELAAAPPFSERAAEPVGAAVTRRVEHDWRRVRDRVRAADATSDPVRRAVLLHEVRKAAKRVRYAGEPMVGVYGDHAARFVAAAEAIQDELGDHHDSVVTRLELRRLADQAAADGDNAFTFGVLHAREEASAADREREFSQTWDRFAKRRLRRWLRG